MDLSIRILEPAVPRDQTIVTDKPAAALSGTVTSEAKILRVVWQNSRGFSDLAAIEDGQDARAGTAWKTVSTIPLQPGLNHITVRAINAEGRGSEAAINIIRNSAAAAPPVANIRSSFYHGRPVSYQIINGLAVYEGDIVLGTAEQLEAARANGPAVLSPASSSAALANSTNPQPASAPISYFQYRWPIVSGVGRVPYAISARDQAVQSAYTNITNAINEFNSQLSGVIQFVPMTNSDTNYAEFDFDPSDQNGVCETTVGYQAAGEQVLSGAINCTVPTILHEMGHVIGLWHEHSRQDRNNYVNFLYANVDKPQASNFTQLTDNEVDLGLYNYASIMHYIPFAFSRDGVSPTLESIPAGIPLSSTLPEYTTGDLDGIKRLYGHVPTAVTIDTNPTGLAIIVDGNQVTAPQTFTWTIGSEHTLSVPSGAQTLASQNYIFGRWNVLSTNSTQTITVSAGDGSVLSPASSPEVTAYLASFIPIHTYNPNVYPSGEGTISATPAPSNITINDTSVNYYEDRQQVTLTVNPKSSYSFYDWYQADLFNYYSNSYTFYVQSDLSTLQAVLVEDPVTTLLGSSPDFTTAGSFPGFAIVVDDGTTYTVPKNFDATYDGSAWGSGQSHQLCGTSLVSGACPSSGLPSQSPVTTNITYAFNDWTGSAGTQTSNALSIHVSGNQTFTANYTPSFRSIVLPSPSCGGNAVSPSQDNEDYLDEFFLDGSSQPITATAGSGFAFVGWTGDLTGTTNPYQATISGQLLGTANFNSTGTTEPLTISSFSPASVSSSSGAENVTVNGSGVTSNTNITYTYFNGLYRAFTYVSPTQLTIHLQAGDLSTPGYYPIGVYNVGSSGCGAYMQSVFNVRTAAGAPKFTISKTHTGNFSQGQQGAQYTITVTNSGTGATNGSVVTLAETIPSGLTLVSLAGTGWTCSGDTCTRSDELNASTAYPAITATVNVAASATSPQVNKVSVSGGGAAEASTSNSTIITQVPASITATAGTPQTANTSTAFATALQATVKDAGGKAVSGVTVTFAAPTSGASAKLSSATAKTSASGVASVTATANATAGSYSVTATVSGVSTPASFSLTNAVGVPASITATTGTPQSANTDTLFPVALEVTVKDSSGRPIDGAAVTFAAPASGASATLSSKTATTNSSGIASIRATANATAGSYTVTATVSGVSAPADFSLTNNTGVPASITASEGTPQTTDVSTAFKTPLEVTVKDSSGNAVGGATVTFTAPASGASATLSAATAKTNSSGVASVKATANATAGSYTVSATVTGVTTAADFSLTNNP